MEAVEGERAAGRGGVMLCALSSFKFAVGSKGAGGEVKRGEEGRPKNWEGERGEIGEKEKS